MRSILVAEAGATRRLARALAHVAAGCDSRRDEDDVWFGSRRVHLAVCEGEAVVFKRSEWRLEERCERRRREREGTAPASEDCDGGARFFSPELPCCDVVRAEKKNGGAFVACDDDDDVAEDVFPNALAAPLIKRAVTDAQQQPVLIEGLSRCVASGRRSALVKDSESGAWFRLKGCGDGDGGFATRAARSSSGERLVELRGCAFAQTARRELLMTATLDRELRCGVPSCNASLGSWHYAQPRSPCCIVERTLGDRRLGPHLLTGLDLLLPFLVESSSSSHNSVTPAEEEEDAMVARAVAAAFFARRPDPLHVTTAELMTDAMLAFELAPDSHGLTWPDCPRDASIFRQADGAQLTSLLGGRVDAVTVWDEHGALRLPQQWTAQGSSDMASEWVPQWLQANATLKEELDAAPDTLSSGADALAYLYARLGCEAGLFLRALHAKDVSWGTYQDSVCADGQWHCNAHTGNFVALPPTTTTTTTTTTTCGAETAPLLGYLDLDMAFSRAEFDDRDDRDDGASPSLCFDRILARERINLAEVLAGGDASSGAPQIALATLEAHPLRVRLARSALYDSLQLCFVLAYAHGTELVQHDPRSHAAAQALERLALITTAELLA